MARDIFETLEAVCLSGGFHQITFSQPKDATIRKMTVKPFLKSGNIMLQFETFTVDGKALHENLSAADGTLRVLENCRGAFGQVNLTAENGTCALRYTKKGKLLTQNLLKASAPVSAPAGHDRIKQHFLMDGTPYGFLIRLGIMDETGRVFDKKRAKFRQINRFLEIVDDVYEKLPKAGTLRVCDLCCGKSYLTFAVYYYLTVVRERETEMTGMDLKDDVIRLCRDTAARLGYSDMTFLSGDIGNYAPAQPPHMIISLHACDIATDLVLYHATRLGARVILSTPCCHHEVFHQFEKADESQNPLAPVFAHSMLSQKLADAVTDGLRATWLSYMGYEVTTLELIDPEETPKNLMLRAIKKRTVSAESREKYRLEYDALCDFLHIEPYLKKYMNGDNAT